MDYEIYKAQKEYFKPDGLRIDFSTDSPEAYYNAKMNIRDCLNNCELILPADVNSDPNNYYPNNPDGDLRIICGYTEEGVMKPVIL